MSAADTGQTPPPTHSRSRSRRRAVALFAAAALTVVAVLLVGRTVTSRFRPRPAATTSATPTPPPSGAAIADAGVPAIRGRILDPDGNAAAGATVHLLSPIPPIKVIAETTADANGAFAFQTAPAPPVRVQAERDPGGAVTSADLRMDDDGPTDLTLVLAPAAVRGTVVDDAEHPIAGVAVSVEGVPWVAASATSDDSGAFRLAVVPFEATGLVAVANGYRSGHVVLGGRADVAELVVHMTLTAAPPVDGTVLDPDGNPIRARVVACEGVAAEARTVSGDDGSFQLPAQVIGCDAVAQHEEFGPSDPTALSGHGHITLRLTTGGSLEGVVVDDRGRLVPSFAVGIESTSTRRARRGARHVDDPTGSFVFDKLPPGQYVVSASAPGTALSRSEPIEVHGGAATRGVRVVLAKGGSVAGVIRDASGAPVSGAELRFDLVSNVVDSPVSTRSDDRGAYRIDGAPAGPFTLAVVKDGFRTHLVPGLRVDTGKVLAQDVTLTALDAGGGLELAGIGAGLGVNKDGVLIASVFQGDPAERAGLRPGDRLVGIDGDDATNISLADAIQRLRGPVGTTVGISVRRGDETLDVVVTRAAIVH